MPGLLPPGGGNDRERSWLAQHCRSAEIAAIERPKFGSRGGDRARPAVFARQSFADCYDANAARKKFFVAAQIVGNCFDSRAHILISTRVLETRGVSASLRTSSGLERSSSTSLKSRFRLIRVLCFALAGRGRMPTETRPLVTWFCEPTISLFDPPTYVAASLRDAIASFGETSTAAAQPGLGQNAT
jgi:hypothetical protein